MSAPSHKANSFDLLRLVAALMVVAGHAYVLSGRAEAEPLVRFTGLGGLGELGVSVFFVISGFLVTGSYERLGRLRPYLLHRALRIAPGLAVALVLTASVLGPLASTLPAGRYFGDPRPWLYPLRNVLLYPVTYVLPGVFETNPYPQAVNGSLWTLRLEFSLYLILPVLAWAGGLNRTGLACAAAVAGLADLALHLAGPEHVPIVAVIGMRNAWLFLAGGALFAWQGVLRPQGPAVLLPALLACVAASALPALGPPVFYLVLPLAVIGLALTQAGPLSGPLPFGDLSYGIYIYAFPVQQALMLAFGPQLGVGPFLAAALAVVLPLAAASWWLVERPALTLKRRVDGPAVSASEPAGAAPAAQRP